MQVEVSRQIKAPVERVFEVFTDLGRAAERIGGIQSLEVLTGGPMAVGTRWTETRVIMGKSASETMWVTGFDPPRSFTAEAESHGTHYTSTYRFEPAEGGTRVTMAFAGRPVSLMARLMTPLGLLMCGSIKKMLVKDIDDLAKVCEGGEG